MLFNHDVRTRVPTIYGDWIEKYGETWKRQVAQIQDKFGPSLIEIQIPGTHRTDVPIIVINKNAFHDLLQFLKNEAGFEYRFLVDYTATDEFSGESAKAGNFRFYLVVQLLSHENKLARIRVKTTLKAEETIQTLIPLWKGANWAEREIYDMFGIKFEGHPDLRRILMDMRWEGHPLRKDYPVRGYQVFSMPEVIDQALLNEGSSKS